MSALLPDQAIFDPQAAESVNHVLCSQAWASSAPQHVAAQAPVNDIVSWPPGLLLLATILYAALARGVHDLWDIEPTTGLLMWTGKPLIAINRMKHWGWDPAYTHFVSGVREAFGARGLWIRSQKVSEQARAAALKNALTLFDCVGYRPVTDVEVDPTLWQVTEAGLLRKKDVPELARLDSDGPKQSAQSKDGNSPTNEDVDLSAVPTARDFLLFGCIYYHIIYEKRAKVWWKEALVYDTSTNPRHAIQDVDTVEEAIAIAAAQMMRRPPNQSILRRLATSPPVDTSTGKNGADSSPTYDVDDFILELHLDEVPMDKAVCSIDFHSYAPEDHKAQATLPELGVAYFRVIQHLKRQSINTPEASPSSPSPAPSPSAPPPPISPAANTPFNFGKEGLVAPQPRMVAYANHEQALWLGILGGCTLDRGRLTFESGVHNFWDASLSMDEIYEARVQSLLDVLRPHVQQTGSIDALLFGGGMSRSPAIPFLIIGLFGQMIVCYFLVVGTSAGVWTSVALANAIFHGRLTDWHSIYWGKTDRSLQPGMKMRTPSAASYSTQELLAVATFDASAPKDGPLRQGLLLNLGGLLAAIFGAIFAKQTRDALGFAPFAPSRQWVLFTAVFLTLAVTLMLTALLVVQYWNSKEWHQVNFLPDRYMVYCTLPPAVLVAVLAMLFWHFHLNHLWPILDALTWVSAVPMAMVESGRLISVDENTLQLILVTRWLMGSVASALGTIARNY